MALAVTASQKSEKKGKKNLKMIFFFLTRNTKRKTSQHHKRLIQRWKYVGGINHVIYEKENQRKS